MMDKVFLVSEYHNAPCNEFTYEVTYTDSRSLTTGLDAGTGLREVEGTRYQGSLRTYEIVPVT